MIGMGRLMWGGRLQGDEGEEERGGRVVETQSPPLLAESVATPTRPQRGTARLGIRVTRSGREGDGDERGGAAGNDGVGAGGGREESGASVGVLAKSVCGIGQGGAAAACGRQALGTVPMGV